MQITNLSSDQVSVQDKSPDIPHAVLDFCIYLIAHDSDDAQIIAISIVVFAVRSSYSKFSNTFKRIHNTNKQIFLFGIWKEFYSCFSFHGALANTIIEKAPKRRISGLY